MSTMSLAISGTSIRQDSNGRFCLNDLHKAAGGENKHRPSYWLELQGTKDLIEFLETENPIADITAIFAKQGLGTFAVKELVYSYAMWISARFQITVIRAYDSLVVPKPNALRDLPPKTLAPAMLRHINKRVVWIVNHTAGVSFGSIGGAILDEFNVNERKAIPITKYREVCAFLNCEPDAKALQGELLEPAVIEYQPPKGMMLITESEFKTLNQNAETFSIEYASSVMNEIARFDLAVVPKKQILELKALLNSIRII